MQCKGISTSRAIGRTRSRSSRNSATTKRPQALAEVLAAWTPPSRARCPTSSPNRSSVPCRPSYQRTSRCSKYHSNSPMTKTVSKNPPSTSRADTTSNQPKKSFCLNGTVVSIKTCVTATPTSSQPPATSTTNSSPPNTPAPKNVENPCLRMLQLLPSRRSEAEFSARSKKRSRLRRASCISPRISRLVRAESSSRSYSSATKMRSLARRAFATDHTSIKKHFTIYV